MVFYLFKEKKVENLYTAVDTKLLYIKNPI